MKRKTPLFLTFADAMRYLVLISLVVLAVSCGRSDDENVALS